MKKWGVLIVLCLSMFIIVIDTTIMNVSISALVEDLNTTVGGIQGAISLYALVMASFVLTGAKLGQIWGAKRTFYIGIILFGIGTFTASMSNSLGALIIGWSVIEGLGSALMMPNIQVILRNSYEGEDRAFGYGMIGAVGAVGAAAGPILGGLLTTYASWRWAFRLEVVIVVIVIGLSFLIKKDVIKGKKPKFDFFGMLLSVFGLSSIVLGILLAQEYGVWNAKQPFIINGNEIAPLGLSIVPFLWGFGVSLIIILFNWEARLAKQGKSPLFHPKVFKNEGFTPGVTTRFLQMGATAGALFTIPLYLQLTFEATAIETGLALMPFSISVLILAISGAKLSKKLSSKRIIQYGFLAMIIGFLLLTVTISDDPKAPGYVISTMILGAGVGLISSQIVNFVLSCVKDKDVSEGSGLNSTFEQLGNAIGVALVGSILIVSLVVVMQVSITNSTVIPDEHKTAINNELELGVELMTNTQLQKYFDDNNIDEEVSNEVVEIYSDSRLKAFQQAMFFLAFISMIGLLVSKNLPNKKLVE